MCPEHRRVHCTQRLFLFFYSLISLAKLDFKSPRCALSKAVLTTHDPWSSVQCHESETTNTKPLHRLRQMIACRHATVEQSDDMKVPLAHYH